MRQKELNQLLCAAMVSKHFQNSLINNPGEAVRSGYLDHTFHLSKEEREMLGKIKANSFEEFAAQVYEWISSIHLTNVAAEQPARYVEAID